LSSQLDLETLLRVSQAAVVAAPSIRDERKVHEMLPPPKCNIWHWCCRSCCGAGCMDGMAVVFWFQDDR